MLGLGLGLTKRRTGGGAGPAYLPLTQDYATTFPGSDPVVLNALNEFEKNIKGIGSENPTTDYYGNGNLLRCWMMRGETEDSCKYDFIQVGNITDFINGWVFDQWGAMANGVDAYAPTGFIPSIEYPDEKFMYAGYYMNLSGSGFRYIHGVIQGGNYNAMALHWGAGTGIYMSDGAATDPADNDTDGFRGGVRTSTTQVVANIRGTTTTNNSANFTAHPTIQEFLGASNNGGSPGDYKSASIVAEIRAINLTGADLTVFRNILEQFRTDLGL